MSGDGLIVAVDGGNSKTDVALLDGEGTVMAVVRGQGSSPHQLGLSHAVRVVDDLIERAWLEAGLTKPNGASAEIAAVFMAGADLPEEEAALIAAVDAQGWAKRTHVANDVFAVLWAATGSGYGVAVTVGAGVNCVGSAPTGRAAWFPALGAITGDWGGGPEIGMSALGAGVRSEDGRGRPTSLAAAVAEYFGYATALDVAVAIHQRRLDAARLVELPPLVVRAAESGDAEALAIVHRQADEVIRLVIAALGQLDMIAAPVDVVLGGGVLSAMGPVVMPRISEGVHRAAPSATTVLSTAPPVLGAALAGLSLTGGGSSAVERVRSTLGKRAAVNR